MSDQWMIRGVEFSNCNCSYGCGCQFNAPSTNGFCEAVASGHIEEGYFNDTRLDGLNFVMLLQPRNGSWITKVRASPWRTWQNTKRSHHQRGDTTFCISPCTPISYTSFLRPTAVSRFNGQGRLLQAMASNRS